LTLKLNPDAVWDDGTPITSTDVEFTWRAMMDTTGSVSTSGWDQIESVDTSDPKTAVVTFKSNYAAYKNLWSGQAPILTYRRNHWGRCECSTGPLRRIPEHRVDGFLRHVNALGLSRRLKRRRNLLLHRLVTICGVTEPALRGCP
jgi:hypothetical protein